MGGEDRADRLSAESLAAGDPTGWFERLYTEAQRGDAVVPWDREAPHGMLVGWAAARGLAGSGRRAVVVGCGYGRDAEHVAGLGFATVAFDVSPTAVEGARRRHPRSAVDYRVADLFDPPAGWRHGFDLVVESMTVQALPVELRGAATAAVASLVAPGGTLLVIAAGRGDDEAPPAGPPWPLSRAEVAGFAVDGVTPVEVEAHEDPAGVRRWRAEFRRPA
ncbi:Methyltransferase domain-containing protein [Micromonospora citrea]|uniref:Methyltransferase domain-containing protein n=1 Tax=Micromonospora citrea TaxID=47855 RepID=A0A1C6U4L0_9ACTN|nr:class I SAM-dependent methyltransferase [Micromonospora citrea]SCL48851.1 Methyltransferase domain-containing protein [Micromonospora citrea]